jgi:bifunctional DNA-binding transcriptional regulator/antitoxin component of YhaV-PrlF toxin-antitoxin module
MTNETNQCWTVSVDEEGILTLPDELFSQLGWVENDTLEWTEEADGSFVLTKCENPSELTDGPTTSTIDARTD